LSTDHCFRTIIEHDDYELFKSGLHDLTLTISSSVSRLSSDLEASVWMAVGAHTLDLSRLECRRAVERLNFVIRQSGRDFQRILEIPRLFDDLRGDRSSKANNSLKNLQRDVLSFYANCLLLRMFFMVSVNLLFNFGQKKIESEKLVSYFNELWHHTTPLDADATILNVTPIPTDPFWLTLLYLYGGVNNTIWSERYHFEDFHGITKYLIQDYLIGLSKIGKPIPAPNDSEISKLAELQLWDQMNELYELADIFVREVDNQTFKVELERLDELPLEGFIDRNRPVKEGRTWHMDLVDNIRTAQTKFLHAKELIEAYLPLDDTKKTQCISSITESYLEASIVNHAAIPTTSESLMESHPLESFSNRYPPIPKECLVKPGNVDCTMIWHEIGADIASQETAHIYEISSTMKAPSVVVEKYDPDLIFETVANQVREMSNEQSIPNLVFLPLEVQMDWLRALRVRFEPEEVLPFPEAKLKMIHSWKGLPFNDIIIICRNRCQWLYQEFDGSRLRCSIVPIESDKRKLKVEVENRGLYAPQTNAIRLVKLPDLPTP